MQNLERFVQRIRMVAQQIIQSNMSKPSEVNEAMHDTKQKVAAS